MIRPVESNFMEFVQLREEEKMVLFLLLEFEFDIFCVVVCVFCVVCCDNVAFSVVFALD